MAIEYNPNIVIPGLLANWDFDNTKSFVPTQNLLQYSQAIATSPWGKIGANVTVTNNNALAPDNSLTATLFNTTSFVSGDSVYQDIVAKGNGTYTLSLFVKAGTATTITLAGFFTGSSTEGFSFSFNASTGLVTGGTGYSVNYGAGWYRIYFTITGTIAANTTLRFQPYATATGTFYLWGAQLELNSSMNDYVATTSAAAVRSTNIIDMIGGYNMSNSYGNNAYYINTTSSFMQFTRATAAPKDGGGATVGTSGALTVTNFLYNDHTWEIWFRIDDRTPGNTIWTADANEGASALSVYQGYHAGFTYSSTVMIYTVWNGVASAPTCASWTVGASGAQINQGSWYQIVVTRSGNLFTPYINGVPLGTGSTSVTSATGIGTSNNLWLGKTANVAAGAGAFVYYSRNTVANMKMYNRALSAAEIAQNFQALRGRFGI
jgi:hypothetical protein